MTVFPPSPFVLSLSKDCTSYGAKEKGQSFDKLRTNGSRDVDRMT